MTGKANHSRTDGRMTKNFIHVGINSKTSWKKQGRNTKPKIAPHVVIMKEIAVFIPGNNNKRKYERNARTRGAPNKQNLSMAFRFRRCRHSWTVSLTNMVELSRFVIIPPRIISPARKSTT